MNGKRQAAERAEVALITLAWYIARLERCTKLPDLETLVKPADPNAVQTPEDMLGVMRAIQAAGGSVTIEEVDEHGNPIGCLPQ